MIRTNLRRLRAALLGTFVCLCGATSSATAAPILYHLNFTSTSGPAPTAGSFEYDATTFTITNFFVVSNGVTYDLTVPANAPGVVGVCDTGEPGGNGLDTFNFLLNPVCGAGNSASGWLDFSGEGRFMMLRFSVDAADMFSITTRVANGKPIETFYVSSGEFSVGQPVPEPSSMVLMVLGGAVLAYRLRGRAGKRG